MTPKTTHLRLPLPHPHGAVITTACEHLRDQGMPRHVENPLAVAFQPGGGLLPTGPNVVQIEYSYHPVHTPGRQLLPVGGAPGDPGGVLGVLEPLQHLPGRGVHHEHAAAGVPRRIAPATNGYPPRILLAPLHPKQRPRSFRHLLNNGLLPTGQDPNVQRPRSCHSADLPLGLGRERNRVDQLLTASPVQLRGELPLRLASGNVPELDVAVVASGCQEVRVAGAERAVEDGLAVAWGRQELHLPVDHIQHSDAPVQE
mmetsp:Transcript_71803/g.191536  ORF Transcript_71803/g.191536 Transcript_71803/m.191536 type:complete len:257 (-) Transcript_71803:958-1728(-)